MTASALAKTYEESEVAESGGCEPSVFQKTRRKLKIATSIDSKEGDVLVRPVREIRPIPKISATVYRSFKLLQQWEGQVQRVAGSSFVAIITDKTNQENDEEEVEIDLAEVAPDDFALVRPGSLFYWAVGYEDGQGIPRQRVSRIRFQRLPGLTTRDIARAKQNARTFRSLFA